MKKIISVLLALVMTLALSVTALAAGGYSIKVTNTNESVSIKGNTYYAYKIFDATYDNSKHVAYTIDKDFEGFTYTVDGKSYSGETLINYLATLTNNSEALDAFAKAALNYVTTKQLSPDGQTVAAGESVNISLTAPGYYLVSGSATAPDNQQVVAACSLTTAKPDATVNPKVDAPSVDKKIQKGDQKVEANTASIGDKIDYVVSSKVPNMKGYEKYYFVLNDTMSKGLTFNNDVVVKIGSTTLSADAYTVTSTVNADKTTSIEIVLKNFIQYKEQAGAAITVTYSATLNQDADLTQTGNINEVKLTYSNNPNYNYEGTDKPNPGEPVSETPKTETKTYTTGLKLKKVDGEGKTLTGAKFEIKGAGVKVVLVNREIYKVSENGTYYMLTDGTYTTTAPTEGTADRYDSTKTKYEKVTVVDKTTVSTEINATAYVDANGVLTFEGLAAGEYTITELVAPSGYNLLKEPVKVVITGTPTLTGCAWTVTVNGTNVTADGNLWAFNVVNNAGTELPSTGGMGTTIFYVLGGVLMAGAFVLLVVRKRMRAE